MCGCADVGCRMDVQMGVIRLQGEELSRFWHNRPPRLTSFPPSVYTSINIFALLMRKKSEDISGKNQDRKINAGSFHLQLCGARTT